MSVYVVDASVVAAAFFDEAHADRARRLMTSEHERLAPDLIHAEVANVVWKRFARGEIDADESSELVRDMLLLPITTEPSAAVIASALSIALATGRTVYDALYIATAVNHGAVMVTADQRLVNALHDTPFRAHVCALADWKNDTTTEPDDDK